MVRKYLRGTLIVLVVLVSVAGGTACFFYRAAQHEPAFYQQAMRIEPQQQAQAGDELEQHVLELHNEVRTAGTWEAVFTEDQINGWLAADLPEKFPGVLPEGVASPRVAIRDNEIQIAARYEHKLVKSVVSIILGVCLTDETNTVAVTIKRIRAGMLPVPIRQCLDRISRTAEKGEIPLRWSQDEGDPVAFVTIPSTRRDYAHREIFVETIELREGEIYMSGRTHEVDDVPPTEVAQRSVSPGPSQSVIVQR